MQIIDEWKRATLAASREAPPTADAPSPFDEFPTLGSPR